MNVCVPHRPKGAKARSLSPHSARPRNRVIFLSVERAYAAVGTAIHAGVVAPRAVLLDQSFAVLNVGDERWRWCGHNHSKQPQRIDHNFRSHGGRILLFMVAGGETR
jgi:hypothetical protein